MRARSFLVEWPTTSIVSETSCASLLSNSSIARTLRRSLGLSHRHIYIQTIPPDIGSLKRSPLFHLDENVFVFSDEIRVNRLVTFGFIRYPELGQRDV